MDAQERNNGVIITRSLRPGVIIVHNPRDAVRVEDRDPQLRLLRLVHSVVNLMLVYAEQVLGHAIHAECRDISAETALIKEIPA